MTPDRSIRPIETIYNGIRFRSRLEARWAVFMDALGVEWEYESEGFTDGNLSYLPDFLIPFTCRSQSHRSHGVFLEIKPSWPSGEECKKADLIVSNGDFLIFAIGRPMRRIDTSHGGSLLLWGGDVGDDMLDFVPCKNCGGVDIVWCGSRDEMLCCGDPTPDRRLHDHAVFEANNYPFGVRK